MVAIISRLIKTHASFQFQIPDPHFTENHPPGASRDEP